ncbi:serine protease inhibitor Kazal-type 2 [Perognathus longimembris pacificus]|uniref:serine protease inhibitor Kazal-type 2 n=1 Tax=Perognathus longimembris pacificus TaxID=214514 RepID=UPI00201A1F32|nr:serine protease inhibitor Kazal-type 2 [Perognathus longimembris pacificus]
MAVLCLMLLLLAGDLAAFMQPPVFHPNPPTEYRTPNCAQFRLPGCPRDLNPICGSDMATYANECTLCLKIWEDGHDIKIIRNEPC